jgi:hypothetical protein
MVFFVAVALAAAMTATVPLPMPASVAVTVCMLQMMAIRMPGRSVMSAAAMVAMLRSLGTVDDPVSASVIPMLDLVTAPIESVCEVIVTGDRDEKRAYV